MCCNTNTEPLLAQLALLAQLQQGRTPPAPTAHWQLALAAQLHRPDWCDHRPGAQMGLQVVAQQAANDLHGQCDQAM